jgi:uncharacterized membrane protein YkvA (DUF1232 family)
VTLAAARRDPQIRGTDPRRRGVGLKECLMASDNLVTEKLQDDPSVGFEPADRLARDPESVRKRFWTKFKRVAARLPFAEDLLAAYYCAFDLKTPRHVQVALLGALAYFVLPFDFVPDLLPILGFGDDAAILATALRMVATHITPEHHAAARAAMQRVLTEEPADWTTGEAASPRAE